MAMVSLGQSMENVTDLVTVFEVPPKMKSEHLEQYLEQFGEILDISCKHG